MERLTVPDVRVDEHTTRRSIIDGNAVREHAMEIYWRLKDYEDTGYTPEEIAKLQGDLIQRNAELLKTREDLSVCKAESLIYEYLKYREQFLAWLKLSEEKK